MGGVNRPPDHDPTRDYQDSCDLLSTGIRNLTTNWEEFSFDLTKRDSFAVYLDGNSGSNNRYYPSGWYNGSSNMKVDPNWSDNPYSGNSCFKVEWDGWPGDDGWKWNGILWQYPEGNWGEEPGYDLTGVTQLTFWARTDEPGLEVKFFVGIDNIDSCGEVSISYTELDTTSTGKWVKHIIDLSGKNLSNVAGGFGFVFNDVNDPDPDGCVFYLDDIKFDKPLDKKLNNVIGGFCCAVSQKDNPDGCTFYLDNIRYQLSTDSLEARLQKPRFLVSYETTADSSDLFLRNAAYIYDNALAMLAFIARGTEDDWRRAKILARTFLKCQSHDRDYKEDTLDYRLRNGYQSGDVIDPVSKYARLPNIWNEKKNRRDEDAFSRNTHTGNIAWVIIALLRFYEEGINKSFVDYETLDSAKTAAIRMGNWIYEKCYDPDLNYSGYLGGFINHGKDKVLWKSVEHNLDVYIVFSKLAKIDISNKDRWLQGASNAMALIESMWNPTDNFFWMGTTEDEQINKKFVEDVQTWSLLALLDTSVTTLAQYPYGQAIQRVEDSCFVDCCGFKGFDFDTDCDGIWFEGTAHMVLALGKLGNTDKAKYFLKQLRSAQDHANHNNGKGIVAACHDSVSTGLEWLYHNRLHIGATAWYIFAEQGFNPFWRDSIYVSINTLGDRPFIKEYQLYQNFPNPFNPETTIKYKLPKTSAISVKIFNLSGQLVTTLTKTRQPAGHYSLNWNGKDETGQDVTSGVYLYRLSTNEFVETRKMVLVR